MIYWMLFSVLILGGFSQGRADEEKPPSSKAKSTAKGRVPREKEAEGTEAADRFEADTVIKSKYKFSGESLEVDPD